MKNFIKILKTELEKPLPGTEVQWQMASPDQMIRGEIIDIRYYDYDGNMIWGATAMILHELLIIINRSGISLND